MVSSEGGAGSFFAFFAAARTSITLTILLVVNTSTSLINHGSDTSLDFAIMLLAMVLAIFVSLDGSMQPNSWEEVKLITLLDDTSPSFTSLVLAIILLAMVFAVFVSLDESM